MKNSGSFWSAAKVVVIALTLAFSAERASATLYLIEYRDANAGFPVPFPPFEDGGPLWTGIVDTVADTLTFQTWKELPGTVQFWSGTWTVDLSTRIVWNAIQHDPADPNDLFGKPFDVTDAQFVPTVPGGIDGTFKIDSTWGFVSTKLASQMSWVRWDQSTDGLKTMTSEPASFPAGNADFYPGWGGAILRPNASPDLVLDLSATELDMPRLPADGSLIAAATFGIVKATRLPDVTAVPEASSVAFGLIALGGASSAAVARRFKRAR